MNNKWRSLVEVVLFCFIFLFVGNVLKYVLVDDASSYTRIMMNQMYHSPQNIDVLFLGSSHCYRSLIPEITDEEFDAYTFNAGTSSQALDGSLALLREAIRYNEIEQVYLEMYYDVFEQNPYEDRTQMTATYIVADYMKPSLNKLMYLAQASSKIHYSNSYIVPRRNWEKLFDFGYVKNTIAKKQTDAYKTFQWSRTDEESEYYVDRGFVANETSLNSETNWNTGAFGEIGAPNVMVEETDWHKSLEKIVELCRKEKIQLTLFVAPQLEATLVGKGNYQEYIDMIQRLADENGLEFYDFNLCKDSFFDCNDVTQFKDTHHLNLKGAKKFSHVFSGFFNGNIDKSDLFYESFEEKIRSREPRVYGVAGLRNDALSETKEGYLIANSPERIEGKITRYPKEENKPIVQTLDEGLDISIPLQEQGVLNIVWRDVANKDVLHQMELKY